MHTVNRPHRRGAFVLLYAAVMTLVFPALRAEVSVVDLVQETPNRAVRDVGFFEHEGVRYYWQASGKVGATVFTWSEAAGAYEEHQDLLAGAEVSDLELFVIDGELYIALAHEANGSNTVMPSHILRLDPVTGIFVSIQTITTMHATRWAHFEIAGEHFLAVANAVDGSSYGVMSRVYRWDGVTEQFVLHQEIPTQTASDWEAFRIGSRSFLAVANAGMGPRGGPVVYDVDSVVYEWNPSAGSGGLFEEYQRIATHAGKDWEHLELDGVPHLALTNLATGATGSADYNVDSRLYRWDGDALPAGEFVEIQSFPTHGGLRAHAFSVGNERYLAIANTYDGSSSYQDTVLYRWNGYEFIEAERIAMGSTRGLATTLLDGRTLLALGRYHTGASYDGMQPIYAVRQVDEKIVFQHQDTGGNWDIWIMNPDGSDLTRLTDDPAVEEHPMISPDGKTIVFGRRNGTYTPQIWTMDIDGGNQTQLTNESTYAYNPVWSPDGKTVYYSINNFYPHGLMAIAPDGSNHRVIHATAGGTYPIVSPDGRYVLHGSVPSSNPNSYDMIITPVDGGPQINLSALTGLSGYERQGCKFAWGHDDIILFAGHEPSWAGYDFDIYWVKADGSAWGTIRDDAAGSSYPCWSPDEQRMVFNSFSGSTSTEEIYVMNRDGTGLYRLTNRPGRDSYPHWGKAVRTSTDTVPPVVEIVFPAPETLLPGTQVNVIVNIVDDSATTITCSHAGLGGTLPAGGGELSGTITLVEGANVITVNAEDTGGLVGGTSITVYVDTTAPGAIVLSPVDGAATGQSPATISVEVSDVNDLVVDIGGTIVSVPAGTTVVSVDVPLAEGSNEIPMTVTDAAGNSTSLVHTLVLDTQAPIIGPDTPQDGDVFGPGESPIAVVMTIDDDTAVDYTVSPSGTSGSFPSGSGTTVDAVDLVEGWNVITITATDAAGNTSQAFVTVIFDTTASNILTVSPADDDPLRDVIDWHVEADDPSPGSGLDRVELFVDGVLHATLTTAPFEIAFDTTLLVDGLHVLEAKAVDGVGNESTSVVSVLVDNTAPQVWIPLPLAGAYLAGTFALEAEFFDEGAGVASLEMSVAGLSPTGDGSATYDPPLATGIATGEEDSTRWPDGPLSFSVAVVDLAGNTASANVIVQIDNAAPVGCIAEPASGSSVAGMIDLRAEVDDPNLAQVQIVVDGIVVAESTTSPLVVPFDTTSRLDGAMEIEVLATDLAGNTTSCTSSVTVDNLAVRFVPRTLNLKSKGKGCAHVDITGVNVALLDPLEGAGLELWIPGGSPVAARFDCGPQGGDPGERKVSFSRQDVIASIRAGIAAGEISGDTVTLEMVASGGDDVLGTDRIRIRGN